MSYKQGDILQLSYSINVWKSDHYVKDDVFIEHIPQYTTFLVLEVKHHFETYSTLRILTPGRRTGWVFLTNELSFAEGNLL